jgi:hypothetical protein
MRSLFLLVALLCALASPAAAQTTTTLGPTDTIDVAWPAVTVAADGLNAPDGYRVKAKAVSGGSILKTWTVTSGTTVNLADLPPGAFTLAIHAYNAAGEAGASNVLGPFGRAAIPEVVAGASATVKRVTGPN